MSKPLLYMVLTGINFGIWPLILSKSGLSGLVSSTIFAITVAAFLVPFALHKGSIPADVRWELVFLAAVFGAAGLYFLNSGLAMASAQDIGKLFVIMILVQLSVPAAYDLIVNRGETDLRTVAGLTAAFIATVLLAR